MKKRIVTITLALILMFGFSVNIYANTVSNESPIRARDILNDTPN